MEQTKKILILYASVGLGHKSIAENIGFYLERAGFTVCLYDAHRVESGKLVRWATKFYGFLINQFPFVWSWLYKTEWFISLTLPYRTRVAKFQHRNILEVLEKERPNLVISTHVTPSAAMDYLKKQGLYAGKFGITFSDFHLHRFWLFDSADFYLANIQEQKEEMIKLGINQDKIFVCGITLRPKIEVNAELIKQKLGINSNQKTLLLASGSQGTGVDRNLIDELLAKSQAKIIVVCGKNKVLFENLSERYQNANCIILGYYSPMEELYAVADLFISKPGGLSTAEALRYNLPILVSHLLPGQEELNYNYLQEKSLVMPEPINLVSSAIEELESGEFRQNLASSQALLEIFIRPETLIDAIRKSLG